MSMRWFQITFLGCLLLAPSFGWARGPQKQPNGFVETDRTVVGPWETIQLEADADRKVSMRFHTGYLSAEHGGGYDAIANRAAAQIWEKWSLVRNEDGTFSFLASDGKHYLTAEPPNAQGFKGRLMVDREQIGPWEKFTIESHDDTTAIRSAATGRYLSAQPH
jgi:hypothetical protein